jgi:hypothetical protein
MSVLAPPHTRTHTHDATAHPRFASRSARSTAQRGLVALAVSVLSMVILPAPAFAQAPYHQESKPINWADSGTVDPGNNKIYVVRLPD